MAYHPTQRESDVSSVFDVGQIVAELRSVRREWRQSQNRSLEPGGRELPSRETLSDIVNDLRGVLFPMRLGPPSCARRSRIFMSA